MTKLSLEHQERCVALVWAVASLPAMTVPPGSKIGEVFAEANALMRALPKPDPDIEEAAAISRKLGYTWNNREYMCRQIDDCLLDAIKRGRQLEREGK